VISLFYEEHGKYRLSEEPSGSMNKRMINDSQLEELEKLALEKIRSWAKDGKLPESKDFLKNISLWSKIGEQEEIDNFIENIDIENMKTKTNIDLIKTKTEDELKPLSRVRLNEKEIQLFEKLLTKLEKENNKK
jgi:hypothetical protein